MFKISKKQLISQNNDIKFTEKQSIYDYSTKDSNSLFVTQTANYFERKLRNCVETLSSEK